MRKERRRKRALGKKRVRPFSGKSERQGLKTYDGV